MIETGIINEKSIVKLQEDTLLKYLNDLIHDDRDLKENYEAFCESFIAEYTIIEYFVRVLGYTIIFDDTVYFPKGNCSPLIDKISYAKKGYSIKNLQKWEYQNGHYRKVPDSISQEIERIGFSHSESPENDLSFWYPKTKDIGFKTPDTITFDFSEEEVKLIQRGKWKDLNENSIIERLEIAKTQSPNFDLNRELFMRLGSSSNKFNFETCHIHGISELYQKLIPMFSDMYFKLEWQRSISLVLREFIKTSYRRRAIYNGMPLNTEFRVFYDFDTKRILGIYNYWDTDTMLENLYNREDLLTFANEAKSIEDDFARLTPSLEQNLDKLSSAPLKGKWSVDFLYDGANFVLIDMAHAECSYYYDKVLRMQRKDNC